jgi:hypothetical protein
LLRHLQQTTEHDRVGVSKISIGSSQIRFSSRPRTRDAGSEVKKYESCGA